MERKVGFVILLGLALLVGFSMAEGQSPQEGAEPMVEAGTIVTYQGYLADAAGPVDGQCDLTFTLYDEAGIGEPPQGGTPLGTETVNGFRVRDGIFTVQLDFGGNAFNGDARWIEITVDCGDGAAVLSPRQPLTAAPYALYAWNGPFWSLAGNAGTDPASHFLGTTDAMALTLAVAGTTALRIEPVPDEWSQRTPNLIGGSSANSVTAGMEGATIGGGGTTNSGNIVMENFGTVGGGYGNHAVGYISTIGGGVNNAAGGAGTVCGGWDNQAGIRGTVGGGQNNEIDGSAWYATIGGGGFNTITFTGGGATIPGGIWNRAEGQQSFAGGTKAQALHDGTFVWADCGDFCTDTYYAIPFSSTAAGQFLVRAAGGVGLGTDDPQNQLHVKEENSDSATPQNHIAQIENSSTGTTANVLALKVGKTGVAWTSHNFITFYDGDNDAVGAIEGNGLGGISLKSAGSDYAEWLPRLDPEERMESGDVVGVFGGHVSRETQGADRVMVISTAPIVLANDPGEEQAALYEKVAFLGQVAVKVRGPVAVGDWIVPSGLEDGSSVAIAAEALTAEQFGQVAGQAWEASAEVGLKDLRVVVGLAGPNPSLVSLVERVESLEGRLEALEAVLAELAETGTGGGP